MFCMLRLPLVITVLFSLAGMSLSGCRDLADTQGAPTPTSGCAAQTAEIALFDGSLERFCGCTEASGVSGTSLTCTVPAGTSVIFLFFGNLNHQLLPAVSGAEFVSSDVYDPDTRNHAVHVVHLTVSGTYNFSDAFNAQVNGSIVVP